MPKSTARSPLSGAVSKRAADARSPESLKPSDPPHEQQNDNDNENDAEDADAAMTEAISVAANPAAESPPASAMTRTMISINPSDMKVL
jgi:hypothetical protein